MLWGWDEGVHLSHSVCPHIPIPTAHSYPFGVPSIPRAGSQPCQARGGKQPPSWKTAGAGISGLSRAHLHKQRWGAGLPRFIIALSMGNGKEISSGSSWGQLRARGGKPNTSLLWLSHCGGDHGGQEMPKCWLNKKPQDEDTLVPLL